MKGLRLFPAENNTCSPFSAFGFVNVRGQNKQNIWVARKQIDYHQVGALGSQKNAESAHTSIYVDVFYAERETCTCPA